jgi:hypothetical protein
LLCFLRVIISRQPVEARHSVAFSSGMLNDHTPYEAFAHEHRVLREGVVNLRRALAEGHCSSKPELLKHLATVRAQLVAHFAFEEDYGLMHYLAATQPALAPTLDRLRATHREILTTLARVLGRLQAGLGGADVRSTVLSTLEALAHHELDERQLVSVALRVAEPPRL